MIKVRAHTCYLGKTGYAAHARSFFREFSKHVDLRVRNFTWDDKPEYLNETDFSIIDTITLSDSSGQMSDYPITHSFPQHPWSAKGDFVPDVDLVLMDMEHHYFYEDYDAPVKIAYTVWESTLLPHDFFKQLLKFDYLWVVTEWHRDAVIEQGYPPHRVFVVNEGVDPTFCEDLLYEDTTLDEYSDGRFKFLFFGRWDYRKAVPEIISAFLKAFPNNEAVDLILSADNPYAVDGMNSTEERLAHYKFKDSRIKVKHFVNRKDYEQYIHSGNVLVTCARSEGWNIPLIEAMAAGTPVIYSDWGAQLEFAGGKGNPVKIAKELPASIGAKLGFAGDTPGLYAEPDYDHLAEVLQDCYKNWDDKKKKALEERLIIRENYSWETVGKQGLDALLSVVPFEIPKASRKDAAIVLSHAENREKQRVLLQNVISLKRRGYFVIVSSHIDIPESVKNICDYFICETDNPIIPAEDYSKYSSSYPMQYFEYTDFDLYYTFAFNHGYAALRLAINGLAVAQMKAFEKCHVLNYDYVLVDDEKMQQNVEDLETVDVICYNWDGDESSMNTGYYAGHTEKMFNILNANQEIKDYFKWEGVAILEYFIHRSFKEGGLNMTFRKTVNEEFPKSHINCIVIKALPLFSTPEKRGWVYLADDEHGNSYVAAIGDEHGRFKSMNIAINYKGNKYPFVVPGYPMSFIKVSPQMIEDGFRVDLPDFDDYLEYDSSTKRATCRIKKPSLIKDLIVKLPSTTYTANVNFVDGAFFEIKGEGKDKFNVQFIDKKTGQVVHQSILGLNMWTRCNRRYYTNWLIRVTNLSSGKVDDYHMDLKGRRVLINIDSSSLGDTLAWFPHVEEFQKKHNCEVVVSTFKNHFFKDRYSEMEFVEPGSEVHNIYASYQVGWFYDINNQPDSQRNPTDFRKRPLQATTTDILGLEHSNLRARMTLPPTYELPIKEPYICIAPHSTAQTKYWNNPTGWQELTDYYKSKGYRVIIVSCEGDGYMDNFYPKGAEVAPGIGDIAEAIRWMKYCKMFVGVSSGLSWLAWTMDIPTTIISGFTDPVTEITGDDKVIRIHRKDVCNSCFNRHRLDAGDWNWCPDQKDTPKMFECSKSITGSEVIKAIDEYLNK